MRQIGKALRKRNDKKQFVSLEESRKNREIHREAVKAIVKDRQSITVTDLIKAGWDVSVARRCLVEMARENELCVEQDGVFFRYTLRPPSQLSVPWRIERFDFDHDCQPKYF